MPSWLVKLLQTEDGAVKTVNKVDGDGKLKRTKVCENHVADVIPVIQQLLEQDPLTDYAYLCHPNVKHISKLKREGKLFPHCGRGWIFTVISRWLLWIQKHSNGDILHRGSKFTGIRALQGEDTDHLRDSRIHRSRVGSRHQRCWAN